MVFAMNGMNLNFLLSFYILIDLFPKFLTLPTVRGVDGVVILSINKEFYMF